MLPVGKAMRVGLADLAPLSLGAAILGTGGGGDPTIGRLALQRQIARHGPPLVISLDSLDDDAFVIPIGMSGSPAVALEKLISESFADSVLRRYERLMGRAVDAVIPFEIGGVNSLIPLLTACATGLPVIDADGMGRAFPSLERTSFAISGVSHFPLVIINERSETVIVEAPTPLRGEQIIRTALVELGGACVSAKYPMSGRQVKHSAIAGSLSHAAGLGRAVLAARADKADPFAAILSFLTRQSPPVYGRVLVEGKITDISRDMVGGYNIGAGSLDKDDGDRIDFSFQNEFLVLRRNRILLAVVPDLICFLDRETAEPITCETLRYGQRVTVIGVRAAAPFRTSAGLAAAGPRSFGLPYDYVTLEALASLSSEPRLPAGDIAWTPPDL